MNFENNNYFTNLTQFKQQINSDLILGTTILYMNINRLTNKLERFEEFLFTKNIQPNIIVFSETFLTKNDERFMNLNNYNAIHLTRDGRTGAGCLSL